MNKWIVKPEHMQKMINVKMDSGNQMLLDNNNVTDAIADRMHKNGQGHLIQLSADYKERTKEISEKKSFTQISETVISSTLTPEQTENSEQKETLEKPESKPRRGRPAKQ